MTHRPLPSFASPAAGAAPGMARRRLLAAAAVGLAGGSLGLPTRAATPAQPSAPQAGRRIDEVADFSDVDILSLVYKVAAGARIALPPGVEHDGSGAAVVSFVRYGMTGVGSYREVLQSVPVRHEGAAASYVLNIYVDNEQSMIEGREWLGWPKLLADISFDAERVEMSSLVTASVRRPADVPAAYAQFQPVRRVDATALGAATSTTLNRRTVRAVSQEQPPVVDELVPSVMKVISGELWSGNGSLALTGFSDFAPFHHAPVGQVLGATLLRKARLQLVLPRRSYPLKK